MRTLELAIVGAGPAGLSAAIEAASQGVSVVVFDENSRPGGQLFKQIHKFFGSREHHAKERGFRIGQGLLEQAAALGVEVRLGATVLGVYPGRVLAVMQDNRVERLRARELIIATGAAENMIPFPGWTLPGVIGAGAAQTMCNLHGVRPGNDVLMVGSGNVGVVVAYQLLQAGCRVRAVIDASGHIGGYGVHAAKVARTGVPFHLSHTIKQAHGTERVEGATIVEVDARWEPLPGTEKRLDVDAICLAVGLSPMSQLAAMAGCRMVSSPQLGGLVPAHDAFGRTSVEGVAVAGDVSGIEEASSAMIGGRLAGLGAARSLGLLAEDDFAAAGAGLTGSLDKLRHGSFGERIRGGKAHLAQSLAEARS